MNFEQHKLYYQHIYLASIKVVFMFPKVFLQGKKKYELAFLAYIRADICGKCGRYYLGTCDQAMAGAHVIMRRFLYCASSINN